MTTYYYYPTSSSTRQTNNRSPTPQFDRMTTMRPQRSVSPPGLSRASTPDSSAPSTPVFTSAFLQQSKMASQKPQVGFASSVVTSAYRIPEWDERSVMRAFASHATHCNRCCDPERALRYGQTLCRTGTELAKDIGKYFYCSEGKPYSTIDRNRRQERVQVEVPAEYAVIKSLFEALGRGLQFASLKPRRPEVHQSQSMPTPSRVSSMPEAYDIKPPSSSHLHRSNTYTGYGPQQNRSYKFETRTPFDDQYRVEAEEKPQKDAKRGSLYAKDRQAKRKSYVVPFSSGWLAGR